LRSRAGEPEQRRVPQAIQPRRGDLDRQDGDVVAESGAGAVHDESGSGDRVPPRPAAEDRRGTGSCPATGPRQRGPGVLLLAEDGRSVLTPEPLRRRHLAQLKESPQAQDPVAFGLSIVKPCFSMVSTKSIVAPCT